jgi:ABC-type antimicrobial peptide transport system permease subunit
MNSWLNDFVYRIKLGFEAFALAIIISIIIAWITVGYKAIKAAIVNPIKSLRTE